MSNHAPPNYPASNNPLPLHPTPSHPASNHNTNCRARDEGAAGGNGHAGARGRAREGILRAEWREYLGRELKNARAMKEFARARGFTAHGLKSSVAATIIERMCEMSERPPAPEREDGEGGEGGRVVGRKDFGAANAGGSGYGPSNAGRSGRGGNGQRESNAGGGGYGLGNAGRSGLGGGGVGRAGGRNGRQRAPNFSSHEFGRLCHCMHNEEAREIFNACIAGPGSRGEVEVGMESPWEKIAEMLSDESFAPFPPESIRPESRAHRIDPSGRPHVRAPALLEEKCRDIRSQLAKTMIDCEKSGHHEPRIENCAGSARIMHLFCALNCEHNASGVDFILRAMPSSSQGEEGMPEQRRGREALLEDDPPMGARASARGRKARKRRSSDDVGSASRELAEPMRQGAATMASSRRAAAGSEAIDIRSKQADLMSKCASMLQSLPATEDTKAMRSELSESMLSLLRSGDEKGSAEQ